MKYGLSDSRNMRVMSHIAKTVTPRTVNGWHWMSMMTSRVGGIILVSRNISGQHHLGLHDHLMAHSTIDTMHK